mmetsp:Transcript_37104/g.76064  ORF Transcript_37104/g.76064 Transcript_37104/m.76064 type:complete len:100 (+) Transcript_37104:40-339(+)
MPTGAMAELFKLNRRDESNASMHRRGGGRALCCLSRCRVWGEEMRMLDDMELMECSLLSLKQQSASVDIDARKPSAIRKSIAVRYLNCNHCNRSEQDNE